MSQEETCEILEILKEAYALKNWDLVDEAMTYLKDYCRNYYDDNDDEDEDDE